MLYNNVSVSWFAKFDLGDCGACGCCAIYQGSLLVLYDGYSMPISTSMANEMSLLTEYKEINFKRYSHLKTSAFIGNKVMKVSILFLLFSF